jgi:hypothetical protein
VALAVLKPYSDHATRIGIDAYFFDAHMNPVSKMTGDGRRYVPIGRRCVIQVLRTGTVASRRESSESNQSNESNESKRSPTGGVAGLWTRAARPGAGLSEMRKIRT